MVKTLAAFVQSADAASIAHRFVRAGWTLRKSGWSELEVRCDAADLVIESASPVLIHGATDVVDTFDRVAAVLRQTGLPYRVECYDDGTCIREETFAG